MKVIHAIETLPLSHVPLAFLGNHWTHRFLLLLDGNHRLLATLRCEQSSSLEKQEEAVVAVVEILMMMTMLVLIMTASLFLVLAFQLGLTLHFFKPITTTTNTSTAFVENRHYDVVHVAVVLTVVKLYSTE
jgi:multisubunit Na+/H+ antiporter MnhB subunit